MDEINRNTTEVIMQIHNLFRYADPVFRLGAIGAIKLIQFFARMVREKKLSAIEFEDFGKFLKVTEGKYDIMNMPDWERKHIEIYRSCKRSGFYSRHDQQRGLDRSVGCLY